MISKIKNLINNLFLRRTPIRGYESESSENPRIEWDAIQQPNNGELVGSALELAKKQWESAEWDSLSTLTIDSIKSHPDRAHLAVLAAAAKIQNGEIDATRDFLVLAREWGAHKENIARALVSGVHETLGRASLLARQENRALERFRSSALIGSPDANTEELIRQRLVDRQSRLADLKKGQSFDEVFSYPKPDIADQEIEDCSLLAPFMSDYKEAINDRTVARKAIEYGNVKFDFYYRPDSDGDNGVLKQIFEEKQYEFGWLPQGKLTYARHQLLMKSGRTPLVIDGGANIGASCVWFAIKFPGTAVLAVEPNKENCELIRRNCASRQVSLYCGAVSDKPRFLALNDPGQGDWGFRVTEEGDPHVACMGISDLLKLMDPEVYEPFILKLDIEGAESLVFRGTCEWINSFTLIIVELHDWMLPNQGTSMNFIDAISRHKFEVITRGENIFCFNRNIYL